MADRGVAVTGLGVVTPAGIGIGPFWQALMEGRRAVRRIDRFDASGFACSIGGQLDDFSAREYVPKDYRKAVKVMARDIEIAVAAADLAFRDAGLATPGTDPAGATIEPKRLGCNIGAGLICSDLDELGAALNTAATDGRFDIRRWGAEGMNNLTPLWLLKYLPNMLSCHVTIIHKAEGPSNCITCGDPSAHLAAGETRGLIARGGADAAIVGGAESKLNPMGFLRQALQGRLCAGRNDDPAAACRPFDADHNGTVIGEGGGLLVLEELSRARQRGARIYAELAGFGAACDPRGIDLERRNAGSLGLAVRRALADAGIGPQDVDLIVTHGTAVPGEDACEAAAWREALGPVADKVPAVAVTGSIGSLFAGAGGVELVAAAAAIHHQAVPPTANFQAPDDGALNLTRQATSGEIRYAVSGTFGVGGQSGACVLRRCRP